MLPLTAPALVTTGLLAFIGAWNEYLFALTFTSISPDSRTLPVVIANFPSQFSMQIPFGEIMAAGIISSIPLILLVFIFQRRIVAGLTAGAVKG
jgi:trehalose/maltose transport system permease protein